jgi:hypothetical protein
MVAKRGVAIGAKGFVESFAPLGLVSKRPLIVKFWWVAARRTVDVRGVNSNPA